MKKLILLFLTAITLTVANGQATVAPGKVTITGQVINRSESSPQVVTANFQNPFANGDSSPAAPLDPADGSFRIEYEMPYGQTINIRYGDPFYTFFAAPGDHVHITIDVARLGKKGEQAVVFSGDRSEQNNRFMPAYDHFAASSFFDDSLEPAALVEAAKNRIQTGRDSLAAYAREKGLSQEVIGWLDSEIACSALYYAAMYREEEPLPELINRLFTEVVDIFDPRYASSQMYGTDLGWYVQRGVADLSLMENPEVLLQDFIQKTQDKPASWGRDIMLYTTLHQFEQMFPGIAGKFPEAPTLLTSDYARQRYVQLTTKEQKAPEFKHTPLPGISRITPELALEPLPTVDIFQYLAEQHPGKVIYIDVSAHWCGPCIAEFPHAKKLEETLAGEDVVFVILWQESELDRVTDLIERHELHADHYFFSTDAGQLFRGTYGISGFPTYLLTDKTGKLVNTKAGRPSGENTEGQIREILH